MFGPLGLGLWQISCLGNVWALLAFAADRERERERARNRRCSPDVPQPLFSKDVDVFGS